MDERKEREVTIQKGEIESYIAGLRKKGKSESTLQLYENALRELYLFLPSSKAMHKGDFEKILPAICAQKKLSMSSANVRVTAFNQFMRHLGFADFCIEHFDRESVETPELTDGDYYKLLFRAKEKNDSRAYLLVKLFANTELRVNDVPLLTVSAVREGYIRPEDGEPVRLNEILREELLEYVVSERIGSGYIFQTKSGRPIDRQMVRRIVSEAGQAAGFPLGYITPRSLQKLYTRRIDRIKAQYQPLIEQSYDHLMASEQAQIMWKVV